VRERKIEMERGIIGRTERGGEVEEEQKGE
jgi:hypothetical protein